MKTYNKYSLLFFITFYLGLSGFIYAQQEVISLWSENIPGSINNENYKETKVIKEDKFYRTSKVTTPTLSIFLPEKDKSNETAVVICPGGGYYHLAMDKEGFEVAKWLNTLGVSVFVLKYRLPSDSIMKDKTIGPLQDAQEAIRFVRRNAKKWNIDINKVGIMGFSAGGHLASTLSTHFNDKTYDVPDSISARPDFSILIYPVISMTDEITHIGSRNNLLGESPSASLIKKYSNEQQVTQDIPSTFLIHATDDTVVPVENSINYFQALKKFKVPVEMHLYEKGGHGFGLGVQDTSKYWTTQCEHWLNLNHYLD